MKRILGLDLDINVSCIIKKPLFPTASSESNSQLTKRIAYSDNEKLAATRGIIVLYKRIDGKNTNLE